MHLAFNNINDPKPKILQMPPRLIAFYYEQKAQRKRLLLPIAILGPLFLLLYINNLTNLIPILNVESLTVLHLILSCVCIAGFVFWFIWDNPQACLIYACLGIQNITDYIDELIESANRRLNAEEVITSLLSNREAKEICMFINSAQKVKEMADAISEMDLDDAILFINREGLPGGFSVKIIKYD